MAKHLKDQPTCAHYWMHQVQSEGQSSSLSFRGPSIYSYGMELARIVKNRRGVQCVLLEDYTGVSNSTSTSGGIVKAAIFGVVFRVPPGSSTKDLKPYWRRIERLVGSVTDKQRPATKAAIYQTLQDIADEGNAFAEFFEIAERIEVPDTLDMLVGKHRAAELKAQQDAAANKRKAEAKERRRRAKYRREHVADVEIWRKTGDHHKISLRMFPDMLRYNVTDNEIETSRGAAFPVDHAKKAFAFVNALHDKKREWQSNGKTLKVGHYEIQSVDAKGNVKAGCHQIAWPEIERLAKDMGW